MTFNEDLLLNYGLTAACWLTMIQMVVFLAYYGRMIVPLKRRIAASGGTLFAPPTRWTLAYHVTVLWVLGWVSVSVLIRTARDEPVTWAAGPMMAGCLALAWVANRFTHAYALLLRAPVTP